MPLRLLAAAALAACLALAAGCGPAGPAEEGGPRADPPALLRVLPVPPGLDAATDPIPLDERGLLKATIGDASPELAERLREAGGMRTAAGRTFTARSGGRMTASVSVWPGRIVAGNMVVQVAGRRLGEPGVRAWTPAGGPASQGIREEGGDRERVLARSLGPNMFVVRATGDVPDDAVAVTLRRLILVHDRGG